MPPFKYMITWRRTFGGGVELWFRGPAVLLLPILAPFFWTWTRTRLLIAGWKRGLMLVL